MTHKSNDGGPAHPLPHPSQHIPGISVRDFFAAAALAHLPPTGGRDGTAAAPWVALAAYQIADAMMDARAK